MTLNEIVNTALLADPRLRSGFEAINQASADALTASLRPNPTFGIVQSLLPLTVAFTPNRTGGPPQLDLGVSVPIDWFLFGKRAAAMAAAAPGVKASEAEFADLVRLRVLDAATAYYDVLEAKALRDLARQDVDSLRRVETVLQRALEQGGARRLDLTRVQLDILTSQQTLQTSDLSIQTARFRLRQALGRSDAADPGFDVAGSLDAPFGADLPPLDDAFAAAVQNRPDLHAKQWRATQARAVTAAEYTKAYPAVTPQVGYTRQFQTKAIGQPDASSWGAGVSVALPLFDRNQGNRAKAASALAQSNYDVEATLVGLRAEVDQAAAELQTARQTAQKVAGEQLRLATQVRDTITQAYLEGGGTLLNVFDAQRNYRDTYRLYITSRASYWRAAVKYNAALGKQAVPWQVP